MSATREPPAQNHGDEIIANGKRYRISFVFVLPPSEARNEARNEAIFRRERNVQRNCTQTHTHRVPAETKKKINLMLLLCFCPCARRIIYFMRFSVCIYIVIVVIFYFFFFASLFLFGSCIAWPVVCWCIGAHFDATADRGIASVRSLYLLIILLSCCFFFNFLVVFVWRRQCVSHWRLCILFAAH